MAKYTPETYFLNPAHESIAQSRYYLKDEKGFPVEKNIFETFRRVNDYIYQNDSPHREIAQRLCEEKKIMYAGRPLAQAGTGIKNMFNCYSRNVPVVTERGVFSIKDINIGDRVLTEDGTFQNVINKFEQGYREKLIRVVVDRMPNVMEVTPDHKIMTRRGWIAAEKLTSEDYISVPGYKDMQDVPKTISLLDYIKVEDLGDNWILEIENGFIYKINDKHTSKFNNKYSAKVIPVIAEIPVNIDLAKLLGYYISEGCATTSGNTTIFTYHEDDKEYIQETYSIVKNLFGIDARINSIKGQKCTQVHVNSRFINNFFKNWIGPSFDKKILPWWVLNTNIEFQRTLLAYTCRGDAHVKNTGQALLTMCNPHSMMQMFFIAQKLGLAYSFKYGTKKKEHYITPVILNIAHDRSQSGEFLEFAQLVERYVPDNRYWRKVKCTETIDYNNTVWDISVDVNHSLQIAGMVGSNCFVLGIGDSREEISECQRIHFHIQAHGGGTGINFSKLRPSGAWCKGANARASGPEGFITAMGYLSANISQGGNRCLPGDALVSMADGTWERIDHIRPGDIVLAFDKSLGKAVPSTVLNFFENGVKDIYEYRLASGKSVRSTDTHRWLGTQTDGSLLVRTIKDMPHSSIKIGFIQELEYFGNNSSKWSSILGYLIGDGCFVGACIKLSVMNDEVRARFIDNIPEDCNYWENDESVFVNASGKIQDYLKKTVLYHCKSYEKFIPDEVFSYTRSDLIKIIEGLFATDGSVNREEVAYYSTSRQLIDDLQRLLLKFGVSGYIQKDNRQRRGVVRRTLYSFRIKHPKFYNRFVEIFDVPGKPGVKKTNSSIAHRLRDDVYFHKVQEVINLGPDTTYCIEIDHPDHLFITDGAVSHNSGANMGILEDWHPGLLKFITKKSRGNWENVRKFSVVTDENKFKQWQWANPYPWQTFNVSVALSDEFMRQVKRKTKKFWRIHWDDEDWHLWDYEIILEDYLPGGDVVKTILPITVCAPDQEVARHEALNEVPFRNANTLKLINGPYDISAYDWFRKICTNAWEDGCPGIFFIDRARAFHNGEYFNSLEATNPCYAGDQHLLTLDGYKTFKELYETQEEIFLVQDARVIYSGLEKDNNNPNYWNIESKNEGFVVNLASPVFLTKKNADIVKIKTIDGIELRCTPDHHIAVQDRGMIEARDLKYNDKLLVADTPLITDVDKNSLDYTIGILYGLFLGDGHVNISNTSDKIILGLWGEDIEQSNLIEKLIQRIYDEFNSCLCMGNNGRLLLPYFKSFIPNRKELRIESIYLKRVFENLDIFDGKDKYIYSSGKLKSSEFYAGLFSGLFFADGTVSYNRCNGNLSIRFCSSRLEMLSDLQRRAFIYGAPSRIYKRRDECGQTMPDGKGGQKEYLRQASYELLFSGLSRDRIVNVMNLFGRKHIKYEENRSKISRVSRTFWSKVDTVVPDGVEDVYCLTENNRRTVIVNGITGRRCAEQVLPPWSVCCLSSIVLPEFVTDDGNIDWDGLKEAVDVSVRSLNWITLLNKTDIEQIDMNTKQERRIGLGTIGMHETLLRMSIAGEHEYIYSQDSGRAMAKKILKFIKHAAYEASIELAKEIGPFPAFKYQEFTKSKFMQQLLKERPDLKKELKQHGIANVTILTQAPTGCQVPDTMIATDSGILTLGELIDISGSQWQPHNVKVLQDQDSYLNSSRGFVNGYVDTKKITLESNIILESTFNHQYRILDIKTGEYLWRKTDELQIGDVVVSRIGGYIKNTEPILEVNIDSHFNNQKINFPETMNPNFARFLGIYFADGSNHNKGIRIHLNANDSKDNNQISNLIKDIFAIYPNRIISKSCESLYINSTRLLRFLEINNLLKQKSHEVTIPKLIRQSSAESLQAFLNGYQHCDGSEASYTYWTDTVSPTMAQQIAICMRLLGNNSTIQIFDNRENAKGDRPIFRVKKINFGSFDFDNNKERYIRKDRKLYRKIAQSHIKGLHFDIVKKIEDSFNLTLDLEVPETETYIANSIVSHNTTGTITGYSSGCEPYFAMAYIRNSNVGTIMDGCPSFLAWLEERGINYSEYEHSLKELRRNKRIPKYFEEAQDITWKDHLAMQAVFAEQVDSSVSKCLTEGTLINTNKGILPIEQCGLARGEDVFGSPLKDLSVIDGNGNHQKVLSHYSAGTKEATRIILQNGASISGARASHKVKTLDGWKTLGELSSNDLILVNDDFEVFDVDNMSPIDVDFDRNTNANFMNLPDKMSVYLAKILGMLAADGHLEETTGKVSLYEKSPGVGDFYNSLAKQVFDVTPEIHIDERTDVVEHRTTSRALVRYIKKLIGYRSSNKKIPDQILQGSFAEKRYFLEGLTLDGYLRKGKGLVVYDGKSQKLAYQAAELLRSFGKPHIYCGKKWVKTHGYYTYSVMISEELQNVITPLELHKCAESSYRKRDQLVVFDSEDLATLTVSANHPYYSAVRNLRQRNLIYCTQSLAKNIGLGILGKIEKISTIEHLGKIPMYDIEMERTHNYLVSGIISHNTINLPSDATVEDVMGAYMGAYDLNIKSTAVYRDGSKAQILETLKSYAKNKEACPQTVVTMQAPKRPEDLDCDIHATSVKGEKWKLLVGMLYGKPYEVFCFPEEQISIPASKTEGILQRNDRGRYNLVIGEGEDAWTVKNVAHLLLTDEHRMITRLLSISLRHGAPLSALVSQLTKCDGDVTTFSKAIVRVLKKYITDEEYLEVSRCRSCRSKQLVMEQGCLQCKDCGYSACD